MGNHRARIHGITDSTHGVGVQRVQGVQEMEGSDLIKDGVGPIPTMADGGGANIEKRTGKRDPHMW